MRLAVFLLLAWSAFGQTGNKSERVEWFRDAGFGLFIHWSVDSQIGSTISHSLPAATPDYIRRFFLDLPRTFDPDRYDPRKWAALAKLAGIRYAVFTAKHHSGFCMYNTATTHLNIMNTPYGKDVTAGYVNAFREQGIAPGFYFSPDDFYYLHQANVRIDRNRPEVAPVNVPGLLDYDKRQLREMLSNYGRIAVMFLDGPPEGLKETSWEMQPDIVVTRGAMETPEQYIPGVAIEGAWESCLTMGTSWQYKPTNEEYKSGTQLIHTLIETRAKGGNLLLNVGPMPNGEIPREQEDRLREIALWMWVNGEAIYGVRPWVITNEKDTWFTRKKDEKTVFAAVGGDRWKLGEWREITLQSVKATDQTKVSVLGQNDEVLEYRPEVVPKTTWKQDEKGLHIRAMRAQRLYDDRKWPNPVVLKITHVEPGLTPPQVETSAGKWNGAAAALTGNLKSLGKAEAVEVGFQYRKRKGITDMYERTEPWKTTPLVRRNANGEFRTVVPGLQKGTGYEFRAVVRHPLITVYGKEMVLE